MDMDKRIKKHLNDVYTNLEGNPTDFLIPVPSLDAYISSNDFISVYNEVTTDKKDRYAYGHKIYADDFPVFDRLREAYPAFKDYFFFLKTNRVVKTYPIHIDGPGEFDSKAGVNWPLINCDEQSDTVWYEPEEHDFYYHEVQNSIFLKDNVKTKEIYKFHFVDHTPHLFRGDVWHTGINRKHQREFRVMVKWELTVNNWQEAQNALFIA
jgi:hypothetical protein